MSRFAVPLLLTLAACGGQTINDDEAQSVFLATWQVADDVQGVAVAAWNDVGKDLEYTEDGDDYTYSGTIEGSGTWEGTIQVDGTATRSGDDYTVALSLSLIDVTVPAEDLTLDGDYDMSLSATVGNLSYSYSYSLSGSLDVSGSAEGHADFDFTMTVDIDLTSGEYSYSASGDIAGHDVSEYAGAASGSGTMSW